MAFQALQDSWAQLPAGVRGRLEELGAHPGAAAVLAELLATEDEAAQLAAQLGFPGTGDDAVGLALALADVVAAAAAVAPIARRSGAGPSGRAAARMALRAEAREECAGTKAVAELRRVARLPKGPSKPRTRLAKAKLGDGASGARAAREALERDRWVDRLVTILRAERMPRVVAAEATLDPGGALRRCAGASRGRTLRAHVRHAERLREWLWLARGHTWPQCGAEVVDYLEDRVATGCGRTVPKSIVQGLAFVEEKGEVRPEGRIAATALLRTTLADLEVRGGANAPPRKKAPAFLAIHIVALELLVKRQEAPLYLRAVAWVKLLKIWGSLRSDDLCGLPPSSMQLTRGGLRGSLDRTKTSGPGRKTRWLPVFVSPKAFVVYKDWLAAGWEVWQGDGFNFARDYFQPQPMGNWEGVVRREALPHPHMRAASLQVMAELRIPVWRPDAGWAEGEAWLVPGAEVGYLKEHSERNFLTSAAAQLGIEKSQRDFLGRWLPEQSDDYVRTAQGVVHRIQRKVADALRRGAVELDEGPELTAYADWIRDRCGEEAAETAMIRMIWVPARGAKRARLGGAAEGGEPSEEDGPEDFLEGWDGDAEPEEAAVGSEDGSGGEESEDNVGDAGTAAAGGELRGEDLLVTEVREPAAGELYWVGWTRKHKHSCLHIVGGCWRKPGIDVLDIEFRCEPLEEPDGYCRQCWGKTDTKEDEKEEEEMDTADESSSTSEPSAEPAQAQECAGAGGTRSG